LAALDFREWLGGEQKINDYCHSLALSGGKLLSELLGTPLLDPTGELTLNMVNVELPLSPSIPENANTFGFLLRSLIEGWQVSASVFRHNGRWWVRASAQVWNEVNFETCSGLGVHLSQSRYLISTTLQGRSKIRVNSWS
jgi:hypothetical protein